MFTITCSTICSAMIVVHILTSIDNQHAQAGCSWCRMLLLDVFFSYASL